MEKPKRVRNPESFCEKMRKYVPAGSERKVMSAAEKLVNIKKSQARWVATYGEENENLKNEIKKLKKLVKEENKCTQQSP